MTEIPFFEASGSPLERGTTLGRRLKVQIDDNITRYRDIFVNWAGLERETIQRYAAAIEPVIGDYAPELLEEMRGYAQGAEVALTDILALNARTEIMYGLASAAGRSKILDHAAECTSLAAMPEVTASGHSLIGQNWDWLTSVVGNTAVLALEGDDQPRQLVFTEAGIVGKIGLNQQGIAVLANILISTGDRGEIGVPYHVILRKIMGAATLNDAIKAVTTAKRAASGNFMIGARGGEAIDIEATPEDFGALLPEEGILAHSNHFLSPALAPNDLGKHSSALTLIRHDRAKRLLAKDKGEIGVESFKVALRDHFSAPKSICRHVDPDDTPAEQSVTGASIVMDLDEGSMHIAAGPPCENDYRKLSL